MEVTEIRVFPVDEDKLKAYVTITLDHCFVIRDLKVIRGPTGYFVSMPSKSAKMGPIRISLIPSIMKRAECLKKNNRGVRKSRAKAQSIRPLESG